jgi:hypothetical protein
MAAVLLLAQAPVATKGKMTVAGQTATLSHAYAFIRPGPPPHDEIVLVLSDVETPAGVRRDLVALDEVAKTGKIHFVRLTWIVGQTDIFEYKLGHNAAKDMPNSTTNMHSFEGNLGPDVVAGKVSSNGPQESMAGVKYEYSCQFSTKLLH